MIHTTQTEYSTRVLTHTYVHTHTHTHIHTHTHTSMLNVSTQIKIPQLFALAAAIFGFLGVRCSLFIIMFPFSSSSYKHKV